MRVTLLLCALIAVAFAITNVGRTVDNKLEVTPAGTEWSRIVPKEHGIRGLSMSLLAKDSLFHLVSSKPAQNVYNNEPREWSDVHYTTAFDFSCEHGVMVGVNATRVSSSGRTFKFACQGVSKECRVDMFYSLFSTCTTLKCWICEIFITCLYFLHLFVPDMSFFV
mmetsp:Transcript_7047/g.7734  ORF Transcript_7047/g.7734 Transcript_7047/m.7734 type:complete len:166 (-) Transcript_7047:199-696(-)